MARTPSTMLALGTALPEFCLLDTVSGSMMTADHFRDAPLLVVMILCNHCPYVVHLQEGLRDFRADYDPQQVAMIGISSNSVKTHPQDGPVEMKALAEELGWNFPYLYDEEQSLAKDLQAACTPEFYLFNAQRTLIYRGQFDESRPGNEQPVTGADLRSALNAALEGRSIAEEQIPSVGCNIKWHPGQAPAWFGA